MIGRILRVIRTPVTLLILLAVLIYAAYWGYTNVIRAVPPPAAAPCVDQTLAKNELKTSQVLVKIYNGGDRKGLAADVGRSMRGKGFRVAGTSNTIEKIDRTVIVGAGEKDPEVLLVKTFFKDAEVRADQRADHSVDVLVGNKYGGFDKNAKTTYVVTSGTACLPSEPSATPTLAN